MWLTIGTIVQISKALSIVLQAGFGIFAMTHEFKRDGKLTKAGKIAIAGITLSAFFGFVLYVGEIYQRKSDEQKQLASIQEQQRKQTELLERQAQTLRTAQRLMFPIKGVRVSLGIAIPAQSQIVTEFCRGDIDNNPEKSPLIIFPLATTRNFRQQEVLQEVTHPLGLLVIGSRAAVETVLASFPNTLEMPGIDYQASFQSARVGLGLRNRVTTVICYPNLTYPRAQVYLDYDELDVKFNRGLYSVLDLPGKHVGILLEDFNLNTEIKILHFDVHFSNDRNDESLDLKIGGPDTDPSQAPPGSSYSNGEIKRYSLVERRPGSSPLVYAGASGEVNGRTMPIVGYPELSRQTR